MSQASELSEGELAARVLQLRAKMDGSAKRISSSRPSPAHRTELAQSSGSTVPAPRTTDRALDLLSRRHGDQEGRAVRSNKPA
jgi:hypothetical protein